ncbi:universal stress protein [Streptomyces sp. NPDC086783]|uniref:universal stress protein n=1 Tax=Streptomyces sp. NPDC086783 TaxID=3365758 RepID=UPI00380ADBB3
MSRTVTAGLDGSPESRAAAEWAAREARLRRLSLRLVHVRQPEPRPAALPGPESERHWSERVSREATEGIRLRHPGVEVTAELLTGRPADLLVDAARDAELLVLGSRGLGGMAGFLVGSVGLAVVARAEHPVVLVRAGEQAADEHAADPAGIPSAATAYRPVVLGLDTDSPDDSLIGFAFDAAARRETALTVVHGWSPPPYYAYGLSVDAGLHAALSEQRSAALTETLRPWRRKFPAVDVVARSLYGPAAGHLVDASREASLVVVGRRTRRSPSGARVGSVTHAVLHHCAGPVAVVPHD